MADWTTILGVVADRGDLEPDQARWALASVLAGEATDAQLAGLIVGLRVKGETVDELVGLATAMLDAAVPLAIPADTIDIVGTGGSAHRRRHALNVSTMASFVAASAGATVCKHGNYRASSTSGSFDFLEAVGVTVDIAPDQVAASVATHGLGFALARTFHPSMRHAGPVRSELGIPTVFNILGPLSHPGRAARQVLGVADIDVARRMAEARRRMGSELTWVVVGADGLDELSTTGDNMVLVSSPGGVEEITVHPADVGMDSVGLDALAGGDAMTNRAIFDAMIAGAEGPATDIVVLNAAAGLVVAGVVPDLASGVDAARAAVADGRLEALVTAMTA